MHSARKDKAWLLNSRRQYYQIILTEIACVFCEAGTEDLKTCNIQVLFHTIKDISLHLQAGRISAAFLFFDGAATSSIRMCQLLNEETENRRLLPLHDDVFSQFPSKHLRFLQDFLSKINVFNGSTQA